MAHQSQMGQQFSDDDNEAGPSSKMPRRGTRGEHRTPWLFASLDAVCEACDRCRKIKSKCEGTEGDRCKNCTAAGTGMCFNLSSVSRSLTTAVSQPVPSKVCFLFLNWRVTRSESSRLGPSFKRGPPKGYIHAIEQRWHQVECILATLMALPRAQDIISDVRRDAFARDILDKVESGPYVRLAVFIPLYVLTHKQGAIGRLQTSIAPGQDGFYNTIMNQSAASEDRRAKRQSRQTREFVSSQGWSKTY